MINYKYLGPWERYNASSYERHYLNNYLSFYRIWKLDKDNLWRYNSSHGYENLQEAMAACDKILIKAGHTLLNQEQYEKLKVLL